MRPREQIVYGIISSGGELSEFTVCIGDELSRGPVVGDKLSGGPVVGDELSGGQSPGDELP